MASELSALIDSELKRQGRGQGKGFYGGSEIEEDPDEVDAPHQALMGALRVEVRAEELSD